jgi:pentose-5-phosphate-3-epimerase
MNKGPVKLAPSILAADFARLGQQVAEAEQGGADRIHVDVMDGHFVPNLSMDGGIDATTAPLVVRAGATVLVAGSAIFGDRDGVATAMERLRMALDRMKDEPEPAERSALQRS